MSHANDNHNETKSLQYIKACCKNSLQIDYMWEDLRREFMEMDPYKTGAVSAEEFRNVLSELCVHLNNFELNVLTRKFMTSDDRSSELK